ncbi:MAG: hypothetical protein IV097_03310 [Burkholderiaceae bacterium]|nr:hypothetical protein [Burkholderiaceae bacterium]
MLSRSGATAKCDRSTTEKTRRTSSALSMRRHFANAFKNSASACRRQVLGD